MILLAALPIAILLLWIGVLLAFARPLYARWQEPVLRCPALIIESDDWGAGPLSQAGALRDLAAMLQRVRDVDGRPAVMTLGLIFEVPDGPRIAAQDGAEYHGLSLDEPMFDDVRKAITGGIDVGVFSPQLHGQCHYWPPTLLAAANNDVRVRGWLLADQPATTEDLPSHLQSRWVDAATLPSRALDTSAIEDAVVAECASYRSLFGTAPAVAVATTFVWTRAVETAWAKAGIEVAITPGRRATGRDETGAPGGVDARMLSGERSPSGLRYLVRDIYFEPMLGHEPKRLADGLIARTRQGRACLVETHRLNFLRARDASLATLEQGLRMALTAHPTARFIAPLELAHALRDQDPDWIETRLPHRLAAWRARLDEIPRFRRVASWTGLALALALPRYA
jgi:hypothetical protein